MVSLDLLRSASFEDELKSNEENPNKQAKLCACNEIKHFNI